MSETIMDIKQIKEILPHRYPFLMVDRIIKLETGKRAVGIKNITINENQFNGHYPDHPIMPGVLIIEAMAQVGGIALLTAYEDKESIVPLLGGVDKMRFRKPVVPGDQLVLDIEIIKRRSHIGRVKAKAMVDEEIAAEGELTFVIAPE